jgi:hypothetical protein
MVNKIENIEIKIQNVKKMIMDIGEMRSGSLAQRFRKDRNNKSYGKYWSLNYTLNGKGHTEYIRKELVNEVKILIKNYKKFRILTDKWVSLSIQLSQEKLKNSKKTLDK